MAKVSFYRGETVPSTTVDGGLYVTSEQGLWINDGGTKVQIADLTPGAASTTTAGLMTAAMVTKLNGIAEGADKTTVDSSLSSTSANPVQNKVINTALFGKVPTTRTVNGKALSNNITLNYSDVGAAQASHSHNDLYYTEAEVDAKIDAIVGEGAAESLDTIGEISAALKNNAGIIDTLNQAIGNKANASDLTSHTGNGDIHVTAALKGNWNAAYTHSTSAHAPSNAEKNQSAWSNITVGSTTVAADTATDTLTLVGSNVTLTPDATNDKITIGITKSNVTTALGYTPPTKDTTYSAATTSAAGLMSAADKSKLDGIAEGANNYTYTLPTASTTLGGVKTTSTITSSSGYTPCPIISGVVYYKDTDTTTFAASAITSGTLGVARGGTGITSNPSMLVNLGSTSAASVFAASPRPGITGTLPIANGGTGATTAEAARTNLGIIAITNDEIDAICGAAVVSAEEMSF